MSKIRIHELAKEMNKTSKDLLDAASKMGIDVKNHMSTLEDNDVQKLRNSMKSKSTEKSNKIIYDRTQDNRDDRRRERPQSNYNNRSNDNRSYGNRSNDNRPYSNKSNDTRSNDTRSNDNRSSENRSYNSNRSNDNRTGENRTYNSNRSYDNRSNDNRTGENRTYNSNRSYDNRSNDNRTGENRSYNSNRSNDNRTGENRSYNSNRSNDNRSSENRSYNSNRSNDNRSGENRSYNSNRSNDNRTGENRSYNSNRSSDNRSGDNRSQGDRPQRSYNNRSTNPNSRNTSGGFNKDKDATTTRPPAKKRTEKKKEDFLLTEITEKTPRKKKTKKDKIVMTFETDKLESKSKKAKKHYKEEIASSPATPQRDFDFTKKTKQKKLKYQKDAEKERSERIEEKLQKEVILVPNQMTVQELADIIHKQASEIIMKLMTMGVMATLNQEIDFDSAALVAADFNIALEVEEEEEIDIAEEFDLEVEDAPESLKKRAPVVTVMGHVDHGKTSLLDAIRNTGVADGEAGGITQHIGASEIIHNGEKIVFLDTPGHEAFTSLRARGAKITDIAILVVAADDGVMPQTIEAIDHSKAAGVPIIVAINKIDKPNANPDRVKQELSERGVIIEEWGGDVIAVPVSAKTGEGLDTLLEMVLLVAEVQELKANPNRPGVGTVIEAKVVKGRGTVASIILEKGTLTVGDPVVAGTTFGKVKAMYNDKGKKVKKIGPSTSVEIDGLAEVPPAGEKMYVTPDERTARFAAERNAAMVREKSLNKNTNVTLEDLFSKIKEGELKELNLIIKADVHGSVEAIKQSLLKLKQDEVRLNIIHANVGAISESDVTLASASKAIIIGFNVRPSTNVQSLAEQEGVDIRTYRIIYDAINDVETAMTGMLDPTYKEVVLGRIQVRATFKVPNVGTIAGGYVTNGKVTRNAQVRLIREGIVIYEGKISSLKRFKDDVKEVAQGYECGIGLENYNDLIELDEIEAFVMEEVQRKSLN